MVYAGGERREDRIPGEGRANPAPAVSLYERVAFSSEDIVVAEVSCGLIEGAGEEG